jgi:hypothetical protein
VTLVPHYYGRACLDGGCDPEWAQAAACAAGQAILDAAQTWLLDVFGPGETLSPAETVCAIDRHYSGGWSQFYGDA